MDALAENTISELQLEHKAIGETLLNSLQDEQSRKNSTHRRVLIRALGFWYEASLNRPGAVSSASQEPDEQIRDARFEGARADRAMLDGQLQILRRSPVLWLRAAACEVTAIGRLKDEPGS